MVDAFAELHGRLPQEHDHVYRETLLEFGAEHSNQFNDVRVATAAYNELLARVQAIEASAQAEAEELAAAREDYEQNPEAPPVNDLMSLWQIEDELTALVDSIDVCPEHLKEELEQRIAQYVGAEVEKVDRIVAVLSSLDNMAANEAWPVLESRQSGARGILASDALMPGGARQLVM